MEAKNIVDGDTEKMRGIGLLIEEFMMKNMQGFNGSLTFHFSDGVWRKWEKHEHGKGDVNPRSK
jgi:hypothetical protein